MKKSCILFIALIGLSLLARAQSLTYRTLKVDLGLGGFPTVGKSGTGDITAEFHARSSDEFAFGLRGQITFAEKAYGSVCFTGDYYIPGWDSANGTRIFVGGGVGSFNESELLSNAAGTNNIGFFSRIGLEAGHFRLSAEYDVTGGIANYGSIGIGFFLGGSKKK